MRCTSTTVPTEDAVVWMSGVAAGHVDRFGERRDFQREVERGGLADIDRDALARDGREALQLGGDIVRADGKRR